MTHRLARIPPPRRGAHRGGAAACRRYLGLSVVALLLAASAGAGVCTVPGTHALIQEAIDDAGCSEIQLADQSYDEAIALHRSLTVAGPAAGAAVVTGQAVAQGFGVEAVLLDLAVESGCTPALAARDGARIDGSGLSVVGSAALPCTPVLLIFRDGFESGDTSAWSATVGALTEGPSGAGGE